MTNFLGAAFGFGARDVGLKAATNSATKNLDKINDLLDDQEEKGAGIGKMWKGMGERVKQFNIASIAGNMRTLTGETGNLTNGLESMGVAAATAAKPILAQMNLTGKEYRSMMGKVTGMSVGLNVGASEIAETLKSIHTAGASAKTAIDAMAMSEKDWVKVTQTTGVTMEDFQAVLGNMVASWGASPEQAGKMLDNIMAIGKAANIGTVGIKNMKGQMDALDTVFEKLPPSAARTADEIQQLMETTVALAGAFKDMGESSEKSMELAQSTANMFAEQSVAIERAQLGLGSYEDSPLFKWMTMLGVSSEETISIIDEGSRDAVSGAKRIQDAMAKGVARGTIQADAALSGLNEALGSSAGGLGYLVQNLDAGSKALNKMHNLTVDGEGALAKYGKAAHSSGRSLQESFDLAKESFETQFRSIARKDVGKLVQKQMKGYKRVGKELKDLGSHKTWGPLMKAVSTFDQMGIRGLGLSVLDKNASKEAVKSAIDMGIKWEFAFDKVKKFGEELSPVMEILGMFGPLGPLAAVGGIAAMFIMDSKDAKNILGSFYPIFEKIKKMISGVLDKIPWKKMGDGIKGVFVDAWDWILKTIPWDDIGKKVKNGLSDVGNYLWEGLKSAFDKLINSLGVGGSMAIGGLLAAAIGGPAVAGALTAAFGPAGVIVTVLAAAVGAALVVATAKIDKAIKGAKDFEDRQKKRSKDRAMTGEDKRYRKKAEELVGIRGGGSSYLPGAELEEELMYAEFDIAVTSKQKRAAGAGVSGDVDKMIKLAAKNEEFMKMMAEKRGDSGELLTTGTARTGGLKGGGMRYEKVFSKEKAVAYAESMRAEFAKIAESTRSGEFMASLEGDIGVRGGMAAGVAVQKFQDALGQIDSGLMNMTASVTDVLLADEGAVFAAGQSIPEEFAYGIDAYKGLPIDAAEETSSGVGDYLNSNSPIKKGPLSGEAGANKMFDGGHWVIEQFAAGISDSEGHLTETMDQVLEDSVIKSFEAYKMKVEELSKQKDLLGTVAKQIVGSFAGSLKSAEFEGEKMNIESQMKAMINIPGIAGVVAAVVKSGADTQVILRKIREDTSKIADSMTPVAGGNGGNNQPVLP